LQPGKDAGDHVDGSSFPRSFWRKSRQWRIEEGTFNSTAGFEVHHRDKAKAPLEPFILPPSSHCGMK
jgi:hypothetical protein